MIPIYRLKDKNKLFARWEKRQGQISGDVLASVRRIVAQVRQEGDAALLRFTAEFDKVRLTPATMRIKPRALGSAAAAADPAIVRELEKAIFNIYAYHKRQVQKSWEFARRGVVLGQRVLPLDSVGVYVPGGQGGLPVVRPDERDSGQDRRCPADRRGDPPGTFQQHPIVAAALHELNVTEIYTGGRGAGRRGPGLRHRERSRASTRSSAPGTPMSPRPSAKSSARSTST